MVALGILGIDLRACVYMHQSNVVVIAGEYRINIMSVKRPFYYSCDFGTISDQVLVCNLLL